MHLHLTDTMSASENLEHPIRARINAWFFRAMDGYVHRKYRHVKRELFGGLPRTVLEIGAGGGANFRYLEPGTHVIAVEPNVHMHESLRATAPRHRVTVDVRTAVAEHLPVPDGSVDAVISSLVLCTVADPERALAEVRRVLRPNGRFWCVEHVAAPAGSPSARVQHLVKRPWWLFEQDHPGARGERADDVGDPPQLERGAHAERPPEHHDDVEGTPPDSAVRDVDVAGSNVPRERVRRLCRARLDLGELAHEPVSVPRVGAQ